MIELVTNEREHNKLHYMDVYVSPNIWIDEGVTVDCGVSIFHFTVLRANVSIGKDSVIGHNVVIERDTIIGERTTIQSQCHITAEAIIKSDCFFGPGVMTMNEKNIANQGRAEAKIEHLLVGNGARIGTGAILAPGIEIGANAFIKAGSFVTKNVGVGEIWANPKNGSRAVKVGMVPEGEWL